jgi:predicted enzyme related to lactoylglutathione lyase
LRKEQLSQGVPPHWLLYVSVEDAGAVAARAKELGGTVLAGPGDVPESGRFVVIRDPQGAVFGAWQPRAHIGARIGQLPGTLCWSELVTSDAGAAKAFYTGLFGWVASKSEMPGMDYTMFHAKDCTAGGMMELTEEMKGVPPHWMPYFQVADCEAAIETAKASGGQVDFGPMDIPTVGRFAVLHDGQGAHFSIIRLAMATATA